MPIGAILVIFDLQVSPIFRTKFRVNWVQEKMRKIDFQDGGHGGYLAFPIGTSLAIFDLQFTQVLPIKFHVNWTFRPGEEAQNKWLTVRSLCQILFICCKCILALNKILFKPNKFSIWRSRRPSGISDRNDCSYI